MSADRNVDIPSADTISADRMSVIAPTAKTVDAGIAASQILNAAASEDDDAAAALVDASILIVDDDDDLRASLGRAMARRGFDPVLASSVRDAVDAARATPPAFAVVDLRLGDGSGLDVVDAIHAVRPDARVVILSGYGNIPTAVAAVKAGAIDYLPKPADADDLEKALTAPDGAHAEPPENAMSADEVRLAHIEKVYHDHGHNISETARRLGMHRRTLQRILTKRGLK